MKNTPPAFPAASFLAFALVAGLSPCAHAQVCTSTGPDVAVGNVTAVTNYASQGGIEAFSVGVDICNIGDAPADFYADNTNRHPVLAQGLFRYKSVGADGNARFEQIGQSWCFHPFAPINQASCCSGCTPSGTDTLGARCADPESSTFMGLPNFLGPKWQVNAATGAFAYPPANPPFSGSVARRLQARISDLDPAQNGGGLYFAEVVAVSNSDAAAANHHNNASHRPVNITGGGSEWTMAFAGATRRERAAIQAWREIDPAVSEAAVFVSGDGWFIVAGRASQVDADTWHYEYAVENLSSDRSAGAFHVPVPPGVVVTEIGFHDVDYTNGDGPGNVNFSGTDWPGVVTGNSVRWATQTFAENQGANALRWGTLYNFRFDASTPPVVGEVNLELFRPGTPSGISVPGMPMPGGPPMCPADWNHDGAVSSQDFFDFLAAFFALNADFNGDGMTSSQDFFDFLASFLAGC
ncbi:MAG: hypothetical protein H7210_11090 [Pyrinomonadaceae bacterium]|nr:hypothetical protein [Phycisphaerales bacterium]